MAFQCVVEVRVGDAPMRATVPGACASLTSCFDKLKAYLKPDMMVVMCSK